MENSSILYVPTIRGPRITPACTCILLSLLSNVEAAHQRNKADDKFDLIVAGVNLVLAAFAVLLFLSSATYLIVVKHIPFERAIALIGVMLASMAAFSGAAQAYAALKAIG